MATSGGIDVAALGGVDWRHTLRGAQPHMPSWFVEEDTDVTTQLRDNPHPTLLIYGDADAIAPPSVGHLLQRHLPNARLEVIAGATPRPRDRPPGRHRSDDRSAPARAVNR